MGGRKKVDFCVIYVRGRARVEEGNKHRVSPCPMSSGKNCWHIVVCAKLFTSTHRRPFLSYINNMKLSSRPTAGPLHSLAYHTNKRNIIKNIHVYHLLNKCNIIFIPLFFLLLPQLARSLGSLSSQQLVVVV